MTETSQGKNSEWLWKSINENEFWGAIIPASNTKLGLYTFIHWFDNWQDGTISVELHKLRNQWISGFLWRRSGNKIISSQAAYLAQDEFGEIVGLTSTSNEDRNWELLELEIQG